METTKQPDRAVFSSDSRLGALLDELQDLRNWNKALERRVEHLELVLAQRFQTTANRYQELKSYFESMRGKVVKIFLENGAGIGLTYDEILKEFQMRYPHITTVNLQRRVRELVTDDKRLWESPDPETGKIRFYLTLEKSEGDKTT